VADAPERLSVYLEPRDLWIGAYVAPHAVYVCPLPCLVFRWIRRPRQPQHPYRGRTWRNGGGR
jgi:hypothetical protein